MAKVIITTNHPAPYMDRWFEALEKKFEIQVIYNHMKNDRKTWKDYSGHQGLCFENLKIKDLFAQIWSSQLVIVGGWTNIENFFTIILSKLFHKKVAIFTDYPFHQRKSADFFKSIFLYRIIDYVFCATLSTCNLIKSKYRLSDEKIVYFPYAVDFPNDQKDQKIGYDNSIKILIANNFMERKGYRVLFDAFEKLDKNKKLDFEIHIAGQGELYEQYKKRAADLALSIIFYGWIEEYEYRKLQNECQVYIHASFEEPFGIPPLDAMAREKVVIVSDGVKSTEGLIRNGINGFCYSAKNSDELYDILVGLRQYDFEAIGVNAKKIVEESFSTENNVLAIEKCLMKLNRMDI